MQPVCERTQAHLKDGMRRALFCAQWGRNPEHGALGPRLREMRQIITALDGFSTLHALGGNIEVNNWMSTYGVRTVLYQPERYGTTSFHAQRPKTNDQYKNIYSE